MNSRKRSASRPDFNVRLPFAMLVALLAVCWLAGGASRPDVLGQAIVRTAAWACSIAFVILSPQFAWRQIREVGIMLSAIALLPLVQLVPLPPSIWLALPERELLALAAEVTGQAQPWRPITISPSWTANALGSLIVPATTLVLMANLGNGQKWKVLEVILGLVFLGCLVALLEFSGVDFDNPLINQIDGVVAGNFANRNHFALFLAIGLLLALVWGFGRPDEPPWKAFVSLALVPFFSLVVMATGSRAGMLLSVIALISGGFLIRQNLWASLSALPRKVAIGIIASATLIFSGAIILAVYLGRAVSVERMTNINAGQDLRREILPEAIAMAEAYFPVGAGFGTFDPAYRIVEPDRLLRLEFWNHVHNDWLEVVLDGGILGAILLIAALAFWVFFSFRAWTRSGPGVTLARTGSIILLLVMLASIPDYPARTPMIMAVVAISATWLVPKCRTANRTSSALPSNRKAVWRSEPNVT